MKKVLVLGGTRFFGKRLVHLLAESGAEVTVATRGKTEANLPAGVKHLALDRDVRGSLATAGEQEWDIVYDNICYSSLNALDACHVFRGKVGRYVLTSTLSVYDGASEGLREEAFDPYTYPIQLAGREEVSYQEGKRQAEAVFFQQVDFPVVAVRFPIVLAEDDYTRRLHFHVDHVKRELPITFRNLEAKMCFIHAQEAASFLQWAGATDLTGPINASSTGTVRLRELMERIEQAAGKRALIEVQTESEYLSPFAVPQSWYMDTTKAQQAGFAFWPLDSWLPDLIQTIVNETSLQKG